MEERLSQFLSLKEKLKVSPFARVNITTKSTEGINYLRYRLLRPAFKIKYLFFQKKHPTLPWLAPDSIKVIEALINGGKGLEFGSGRSTLYFSGRLDELYSIEHHQAWYEKVHDMLQSKGVANTKLKLIQPNEELPEIHLTSEDQFFMTQEQYPIKDSAFKDYTNAANEFEEESLDFILIDGRARKSCALNAIDKLKKGGLMILDNSERKRYGVVHQTLAKYPSIQTTTGLTDTTIWLKT